MGYQQIQLQDFRNLVYEQLDQNRSFWLQDEIDRYIRQSLRVFNVLCGFWRGKIDIGPAIAGQVWYDIPGLTYALRVEANHRPLGVSSLWDLDYGRPTWESDQTSVNDAPSTIQSWAPAGVNLIAIWPASAAGGESLVVEGVVSAPQPVGDTDYVDIGKEELNILLDYIQHIAQFKEGGQEFQVSQENMKTFLRGAAARNAMLMESSKFRMWMGLSDEAKRPIRSSPERVGAR